MIYSGVITANTSPLIPQQFPAFYRDKQSLLIAFVQAYYEWMEQSGGPLYYQRNFLDFNDIDNTLDSFLVHFKNMFFQNIQFSTQADTRQLIKHALDIYRSKGTERQVKLLFQLIFGEQIEFYYPKTDLMRLSDGQWKVPVYLELALSPNNVLLAQKIIIGVTSGATAFVDSVIRKQDAGGNLVDIAYLSAITGTFQTGEIIAPTDGSLSLLLCPAVSGSLTTVDVTSAGNTTNYEVGDQVIVTSPTGEGGLARVDQIVTEIGILDFTLNSGGYGYTTNAQCYVSNTTLIVNNVVVHNSYCQKVYRLWDQIIQPLANISYISANGTFSPGDVLSAYSNTTTFSGNGVVLAANSTNSTAGTLLVATANGTLNANLLVNQSNAVGANLASSGYTNVSATGLFIGERNYTLAVTPVSGTFIPGEALVQYIDNGPQYIGISNVVSISTNSEIISDNTQGIIQAGYNIIGTQSGAVANVLSVSVEMGLIDVSNTFYSLPGAYITSPSTTANVIIAVSGQGGQFGIANTFIYSETVPINTDKLLTYGSTLLNATSYGFPANASANATNVNVAIAMAFSNMVVGQIQTILPFNAGQNYVRDQFTLIYEPNVYGNQEWAAQIYMTGATTTFVLGEEVIQASSNARGLVLNSNGTAMMVQNLREGSNNQWVVTANVASQIVGVFSAATANITSTAINEWLRPEAVNANVSATVASSNGAIVALQVISSGYNFTDGQLVNFGPPTNGEGTGSGTGIAHLGMQGIGQGFYATKGGFLSDVKKLFDGFFYQEFSYEILSSQTIDKYEQTLKQLSHVAGIALFGKVVFKSVLNTTIKANMSIVSINGVNEQEFAILDEDGTDDVLTEGSDLILTENAE